jgi:predicted pyridoxine 5'-phosphate oxidase superfamily flavin-nucleotide-binding protein
MILNNEHLNSIRSSVLCWLATVDKQGTPNVSPKEIFAEFGNDKIIVANIASPQTVKNIKDNPKVCISFIDVLVQKGYQIKGKAQLVSKGQNGFTEMKAILDKMTQGKFPFQNITLIQVESIKPIIAPKYILYPETTVEEQIASAKETYGFTSKKM